MTNDPIKHIWLPYTQMKNAPSPLVADRTRGSHVVLKDGRELIDGIASWWTACHGYNHPHIIETMQRQLERMPHFMLGGAVHEPAIKLAARLAKLLPGDLNHVFFADSGSVAVEVAMKMAVQYWLNKGEKGRNRFVSFHNGYHGDTMACMSLCDPEEGMHAHFKGWLPKQILADIPDTAAKEAALDRLLVRESERIAALVIEPLVQGAGGMKFHSAKVLKLVAKLCKKHGILLIADEVFTGFGRTGTMFAVEQAGVVPDIICLGKALTGGVMSLAATVARKHVYDAFLSDDPKATLMHGPTFMGNALACSAANASLDLFEDEPRLKQVKKIEKWLREGLEPCRELSGVKDVRVMGAIGVVQMKKDVDSAKLKKLFAKRGLWVRPFRDIIYLTPAFTISESEVEVLCNAICEIAA